MTCETCTTLIKIAVDSDMLLASFTAGVTSHTGVYGVVVWIGVAVITLIPCSLVPATVYGEILIIVIGVLSRCPDCFCMTQCTIRSKSKYSVRRVACLFIILLVASITCVGRIVIITIVAECTFI